MNNLKKYRTLQKMFKKKTLIKFKFFQHKKIESRFYWVKIEQSSIGRICFRLNNKQN